MDTSTEIRLNSLKHAGAPFKSKNKMDVFELPVWQSSRARKCRELTEQLNKKYEDELKRLKNAHHDIRIKVADEGISILTNDIKVHTFKGKLAFMMLDKTLRCMV